MSEHSPGRKCYSCHQPHSACTCGVEASELICNSCESSPCLCDLYGAEDDDGLPECEVCGQFGGECECFEECEECNQPNCDCTCPIDDENDLPF